MRVLMGEIVNVTDDLTTKQLGLKQKISVIWQSLIADSKILGNRRKAEAEKELKARNDKIDRLRDGLLASLDHHLSRNKALEEFNEEADTIQFAIDRASQDVLDTVLSSQEFNSFEHWFVELDKDLINSFGNAVPIIVAFRQKGI